MNEFPVERVLLLAVSGIGAVWALIRYAFPKVIESRIKRAEAETEAEIAREIAANRQKDELFKVMIDQNSLMTQFVTDQLLSAVEKVVDRMDIQDRRQAAVETKLGMMVYELIAQASDKRAQDNLRKLARSDAEFDQTDNNDITHSDIHETQDKTL